MEENKKIKVRDVVSLKVNSKTKQISFDLKKRKMKIFHISPQDLLNIKISKVKKNIKKK